MTPKKKIFLVSKDENTIHQIDAISKNGSPIEVDGVFADVDQAQQYLDSAQVSAGIVDIDQDPQQMLNQLREMIHFNPNICTVVVSHQMNQDLILSAMQAGARHFLQKDTLNDQLSDVMGRLLTHTGPRQKAGSVLTVFSASGGCGATTVSLNLANELRLNASKPVLVIDLDRCYGAASAYLDLKSEFGIEDILSYEGTIDKHLIQSSSCSYKDDFHVLLSKSAGNGNNKSDGWGSQNLAEVIGACRHSYGFTVIDAPRLDEQTVKTLSEVSDFTIVVFQLTLKDVKFAKSIMNMFRDLGLSQDKIIPLANRFQKRGQLIEMNDGKRALGTETVYKVRSDWRNAMNCLNKAKTLADVAPRSGIRKDLRKLVDQIQLQSEE